MTSPAALAVDLGSRTIRVWAAHHGTVSGPWGEAPGSAGTPVRRGRVVDVDGVLLVGDGALHPGLAPALARASRVRVHRADAPRMAALTGAGQAAMSLLRHPGHHLGTRASGGMMTATLHDETDPAAEPMELLRTMLEEQFAAHTARLAQLTMYARLPRHAGYDAHTLDVLAASARQRIAETAQALRRMSEGTYGRCEGCHKPIPLGRLRAVPYATHCARCAPAD